MGSFIKRLRITSKNLLFFIKMHIR